MLFLLETFSRVSRSLVNQKIIIFVEDVFTLREEIWSCLSCGYKEKVTGNTVLPVKSV